MERKLWDRKLRDALDLYSSEVVALSQEMVRIPSISGEEEKLALFVAGKLKEYGLEVTVDEVLPGRPNVYGVLRGKIGKPILMYNGHTDVVPPGEGWTDDPYSGVLRAGRIFGRGSADMKGPLASMMIAAKALKGAGVELRGNLVITAVIAEEENQMGTRRVVDGPIKGEFAIVGEPTRLNVCTAHKGDVAYEITTIGKAVHASVLHEGINAIYKMKEVIDSIEKFAVELEKRKRHPLLGPSTISVGTIEGGTIPAAVPAFCKIKLDRRLLPGEDAETGKKELESLIDSLKERDPDLVADVRTIVEVPPMETRQDHAIVRTIREVVLEVTGRDPGIEGVPYTTDGAILVKKGIPTVIFGPGDIKQAHQPDEWISVDEMVTATRIYAQTALQLLW